MRSRWALCTVAALVASTSGCLATKNDILLLQTEIKANEAQGAHADSARAAQGDSLAAVLRANQQQTEQLFAQVERSTRITSDSLAVLSARVANFTANTNETLREIGTNLLQLSQLNQSQANQLRTLQKWQEQQAQVMAGVAGTGVPDSNRARSASADVQGPATLFTAAKSQMATQAWQNARSLLDELLQNYPTDELAPEAEGLLAKSYNDEGNLQAADSVYQVVVAKYPKTDAAGTALYKRADLLCGEQRRVDALALLKQIVSDYPNATTHPDAVRRVNQSNPCN